MYTFPFFSPAAPIWISNLACLTIVCLVVNQFACVFLFCIIRKSILCIRINVSPIKNFLLFKFVIVHNSENYLHVCLLLDSASSIPSLHSQLELHGVQMYLFFTQKKFLCPTEFFFSFIVCKLNFGSELDQRIRIVFLFYSSWFRRSFIKTFPIGL